MIEVTSHADLGLIAIEGESESSSSQSRFLLRKSAAFDFSRLADSDCNKAVFTLMENKFVLRPENLARIRACRRDPPNDGGLPTDTVRIRRSISDVVMPHLQVLREGKEIVLDWKELFSRFFGGERLLGRRLKENVLMCSASVG